MQYAQCKSPQLRLQDFFLNLECLNAFKSTSEVCIDQEYYDIVNGNDFDDNFFVNMARQGVRSFVIKNSFHPLKIDARTALAFAVAKPTAGGARRLEGVELRVESDFLAKIRQVNSPFKIFR